MSAGIATLRAASAPRALNALAVLAYVAMLAPFIAFLFMTPGQIRSLNNENSFFENLGALSFLLASLCFFLAWLRSDGFGVRLGMLTLKRNVIYLGLAALLFLGAAEELSWGQRIVNYPTPGFVAERNMQGEMNIHNLEMFHTRNADGEEKTGLAYYISFSRLSTLFALGATVALPVVYAFVPPVRRFLDWLRIPAPALWIAPLLLLSYAAYKVAVSVVDAGEFEGLTNGLRMYEVREFQLAFIFAVIGASEFAKMTRRNQSTPD